MAAVVTKTVSKSTGSSNGSFGNSAVTGIEMCDLIKHLMNRTPYAVLMTGVVFVAGVVVLHLLHKLF